MHNVIKVEYETIKQNDCNLIFSRYAQPDLNLKNSEWEVVKLGGVIEKIKDGGTPPRKKSDSEKYFFGEINWCVVSDIKKEIFNTKEKLTELGLKKCSAYLFPIDSIIISLGATIGKVGIAKKPTATKQGLSGIIVNKKIICPKYLYYILLSKSTDIQNMATGATIKEVRPQKLANTLQLPLPPIETQHKIVEELESIENRIKQIEDMIKQEQEKFDCILNEIFNI